MRRITSACLLQTMRFDTYKDADPEADLEIYCRKLDKSNAKYKIKEKIIEESGAVVIKIQRQYNSYPVDDYMD